MNHRDATNNLLAQQGTDMTQVRDISSYIN